MYDLFKILKKRELLHEKNDDGNYVHAEIDICGNIVAISEADEESLSGNTMQFCIQYNEDEKILLEKAYSILKKNGTLLHPLGECFYSSSMADFIDEYGVHWCLFL